MDTDLARRRAELLRRRLARRGLSDARPATGQLAGRPDPHRAPLSASQRRMWVLRRLDPTGTAYNVCLHVTFHGELNVPALRTALHQLVVRHEVLRTRYPLGADQLPIQRIDPAPSAEQFPIPLLDVRDRPDGEVDRLVTRLGGHRFDLAREWPLRLVLYRTGEREHRLGIVVHHIAWDGGTWPVISAELSTAYTRAIDPGTEPLEPLAVQYGDIAAAQALAPASRQQAGREYWTRQLAGLPGPLPLPADHPGSPGGGRRVRFFDQEQTRRLTELAGACAVTPYTVLLAAFGALLHRYGCGTDLAIGSAGMNRDSAAAQALVGNFGNTLLLRLDAAGDPDFAELLRRTQVVCSDGFAHQDVSYDEVLAALAKAERAAGRRPAPGEAFNVMLLFLTQDLTGPRLPGVHTSWRNVHNGTHQFDLSLEAFLIDGRMELEATYSRALFSAERIDQLLADLAAVLDTVTARPGTRLSEIPVRDWPVSRPSPAGTAPTPAGTAPMPLEAGADELPRRLCAIMAELLECDGVAADGDFFALGGNSLLATKLVARVRDTLGADISVRTVGQARTPAALAAAVAESTQDARWRTVHPTPSDRPAPLSVAQHALWFLYQASGPAPDYNVAFARRLGGRLDVEALRAALTDLVARHPALRTVVRADRGEPEQVVWHTGAALDAGAALRVRTVENLDAELDRELRYGFRLEAQPAFRPTLLTLPDRGEYVLVLLLHHLVADEWSQTVLFADLSSAYRARAGATAPKFPPLPVSYGDYARWQREALGSPELERQREFWRERLAGLPEQVALPTDHPRPARPSGAGDSVTVELPRPVLAGLRGLAARLDTTPFVVWHALVALVLSRNGAGRDIPLGTPVSGRGSVSLHGVVGLFVNSVVLRADLSGAPSFTELVARLAEADLAAFGHQDLPFERVVELLEPPRVLGRNPLFQTMIVYDGAAAPKLGLPEVTEQPLPARLDIAKFDLSFTLCDAADTDDARPPAATVRYSTELFDRSTPLRLAEELARLAEEVATDPDRPLSRIEHRPETHRARTVHTWNATEAPIADTSVPALFAARAKACPGAVAVVDGARRLSYRELDEWTARLAGRLRAEGVGPERTVGVHYERSVEMVVALLAVQRAGGAFVPLEPSWPRPRIADVVTSSRPALVLSADPDALRWTGLPVRTVHDTGADSAPVPPLDPENLAYVMYTSGSTGTPKGAMIRHGAIANRLLWQVEMLGFGAGDAALFKAPLGFDISVNEIFLPLVCGAKLVVCPAGMEREVHQLAQLVHDEGVTFCYLTSSMLELLVNTDPDGADLTSLRHVWCGGELLTPELFGRFRARVSHELATLYHGYGPAEATIGVSHEIYRGEDRRGSATIGRPNPNTTVFLLDDELRAVSVGVAGEIYLGGLPLARGYVGEPRRTAERFVANPFARGERLYRTGDLARWRPDGVLEFLGRADNQVKIRGMRVELEEIESVLARHPKVRQACVRVQRRTTSAGPVSRLLGYVVGGVEGAEVRTWLSGELPGHMVPDLVTVLDAMPMLPSGKVDRAALPEPVSTAAASEAPRGPRQTRLAELFAEVLGIDEVGAHDDFFGLGGDSILSMRLVAAARDAGLWISVRDVFAAPTPAELAELAGTPEPAPVAAVAARSGPGLPLSPLQRGLLFHSLSDGVHSLSDGGDAAGEGPDPYIAQPELTLTGQLDPARLRAALDAVLGRHEALRAGFEHAGLDEPIQLIAPSARVPWEQLDLTGLPETEREGRWTELRAAQRAVRFELDRPPLLRAALVRFAEREHRLLLTNHHLIFDGWSLPLLVTDLLDAYADGELEPAPGQYSQFLDWLAGRDTEAAERAWLAELDGVDGPTLLARGWHASEYQPSKRLELTLDGELTAALTELARAHGVTVHTVLMSVWGVLLGVLTGRSDVLFGSTVSGRPAELPAQIVGLFINTIPVRVATEPSDSFSQLLRRVHASQVDLLEHQHLGLADIQRGVRLGELFDTLLVWESYPQRRSALADSARGAGLDVSGLSALDDTHYPLTVLVNPGQRLRLTLKYQPALFDARDVGQLGERLRALLAAVTHDPGSPLAQLSPLLPGEPERHDGGPSATGHDVVQLIERAASRFAERPALRFGELRLSYAELHARVDRLAAALASRGAGPERVVGVAARRGMELVVGLLAALRAGAAFLPLDPDQPPARLQAMLNEADPVCVLATAEAEAALPRNVTPLLFAEATTDGPAPQVAFDPEHPAYVLYTSGSTGTPKGAVLTRGALHNRLSWMVRHLGFGPKDVVLQKTPASFDVSVWEFVLPFMVGAELVVARPDGHRDPRYLAELIQDTQVSAVHFVPSMLRAFLAEPAARDCRSLRLVLCSGELLPVELAERAGELLGGAELSGGAELHNLYGPTEATIDVTASRYRAAHSGGAGVANSAGRIDGAGVPIGGPIDGVRLRVLDGALRPVPPGVAGELYLGGVQLARGYLRQPGLTASRFVAAPSGERLYRTGDVVRVRQDGELEFLGRGDDQVKIGGVRVEPGETQAALLAEPGVAAAAVLARDDGPNGTWLVGYVVPEPGRAVQPAELRDALARRLPDQFVPSAIVALPRLPLTTSGKLDRRALPAPDRSADAGVLAPNGPEQALLCALYAEVLGLTEVGADANFFALGGDSISALRLAARARAAGLALTPRQVFEHRTPVALGEVVSWVGRTVVDRGGSGELPLTPIMHRLLERGGPIGSFAQSVLVRTPAGLSEAALAEGLRAVLAAHDVLRARLVHGQPAHLYVPEAAGQPVYRRELRRPSGAELERLTQDEAAALDPGAGRMLRAVLFDAGEREQGRLLLVAHHLVVDGVSWRILLTDLARACAGERVRPPATSFRSWTLGLADRAPALADQLPMWRAMLSGAAPRLGRRALDPERDVLSAARRLTERVPAELTRALLTTLPATLRAGTQDVLLAALLAASARCGDTAPLVRMEGHGREEELVPGVDLTRTVGWFTSAFPVRLEAAGVDVEQVFGGGPAGGVLVKRARDALRALPDRGAGYGVLRHLLADTSAELSALPEPLLGFNYLGRFDEAPAGDWSMDTAGVGSVGDPEMRVPHVVDVNVLVDADGMRASWSYLPDVITEPEVAALAGAWVAALHGLARHGETPEAAAPGAEDLSLRGLSADRLARLRRRFES